MKKHTCDWLHTAIVLISLITISVAVRIPPQPRSQIETNDVAQPIVLDQLTKDEYTIETLNYELSKSTLPKHYKITLQPYLKKDLDKEKYLKFDGTVEITLTPQYNTKTIELNVYKLNITKAVIDKKELKVEPHENVEKVVITSATDLKKGTEYVLTITYEGTLEHDDLKGFYKSTYKNEKGEEVILATTQFESSGARRAFPCYDELGIKATFQVIIKAHKDFKTVLSNSKEEEIIKTVKDDDWKTTTFAVTKSPMSTYLLAFIVSDFESKSITAGKNEPEMNIYSQKKYIELGPRSLEFGQKVLKEINTFLKEDVPYSTWMNKLDQVGIPDFAAGAMENWGLVTYRELQLLWDETKATTWSKQKIYITIAHEFAHQWFGNLVTPTWWKYIWLNEGFATYVSYVAAEQAIPNLSTTYKEKEWRLLEHFAIHERQKAFTSDSLKSTRPMTSFAESPEDVNSLFDNVIYAKAGSILFMLEHILTKPVFQNGLNSYLQKSKLSTVTPNKLWDALQEAHEQYAAENQALASNLRRLSVHDIGNSWSLQAGYPIVTVTKEGKIVKLEQSRFFTDSTTENNTVYLIPINYLLESELKDLKDKDVNTQPKHFLTSKSRNIAVDQENDFILVNNLQTGYYRVNYDLENWNKIIDYISKADNVKNFKPVTLSQIIDDAFTFSRIGLLPYNYTLKLAESLEHVDDYVPWYAAVNNLKTLDLQYSGSSAERDYMVYQQKLLTAVYKKAKDTTKDSTHSDKLNRLLLLKRACDVNVDNCRNETEKVLKDYIKDTSSRIPPDDQLAIYCGGARQADEELYNALIKRYTTDIKDEELERENLILGLGCMNDESLLDKLLDEIMQTNTPIKEHITEVYLGLIDGSRVALDKVLSSYPDHYGHIKSLVGEDKALSIVRALGNKCSSNDQLKSLKKFEQKYDKEEEETELQNVLKGAIENVQERVDWNEKYLDDISEWFTDNDYVSTDGSETILMNLTLLCFGVIVTYLFNKH